MKFFNTKLYLENGTDGYKVMLLNGDIFSY